MVNLVLWGGPSYGFGDPEPFESVRAACEIWADRHWSNGRRAIDGICYPCWGDCPDDEYVLLDPEACDALTRSEVLAVADGGALPFGW